MRNVDIRLLGPVELSVDGTNLRIGRPKVRSLLALLSLNVGCTVSIDRLVDALWTDRIPNNPRHALHMYVSRLRDLHPTVKQRVATTAGGYRLDLHRRSVDTVRFEALVKAAHRRISTQPDRAAAVLDGALALWRGDVLGDLRYEEFATGIVRRLEEMRIAAVEDRYDAAIRLGAAAEVLPQLHELTVEHALRDRPIELLIRAMRAAGHHGEARNAYREYCVRIARDFGMTPSPTLRMLAASSTNGTSHHWA